MSADREFEQQTHARLLNHDVTASEELACRYLEAVRRHVEARGRAHGVFDEHLINDAATDAVLDYIRRPDKFDPGKSGLLGYLKRAAERDLINAVTKDRRKRRGEELSDDVELAIVSRKKPSELERIRRDAEAEIIAGLEPKQDVENVFQGIENLRDRQLLKLMLKGERETAVFAAVLGIQDVPVPQQRKVVKQHKDRLKQQLKRLGEKARG